MKWCELDIQASSDNFTLPLWKLYLEDSTAVGKVDWGDGSAVTEFSGTASENDFKYSHTYAQAGNYSLKFYGDKVRFGSDWNNANSNTAKVSSYREIRLGSNFNWYAFGTMTYNCSNLKALKIVVDSSDPNEILIDNQPICPINMNGRCQNLEQFDVPQ